MPLDLPPCTEQEPQGSLFNEDMFQNTSFMDLLQTSPDVAMSYYMSEDEPLALPPMLPNLSGTGLSPSSSVNIFDMISQDMLLGSSFPSSSSGASTEVTYASQYAASSSAPFTSAGDVFLPNFPITTASNTFIKPPVTFAESSRSVRSAKNIIKPKARHAKRSTTSKSGKPKPAKPESLDQFDNLFVMDQKQMPSQPSKSKNTSARNSTKNSPSKCQGLHSAVETPSFFSSVKQGRTRSKGKSILLTNLSEQSAFVPVTTRGSRARSTTVTHTVTRAVDSVTETSLSFNTKTVTYTTASRTVSSVSVGKNNFSSLKTTTITCSTATKTQSPVTYAASSRLDSMTMSSLSSHTITKSKSPATIISTMQSTYSTPAGLSYSSPKIIYRPAPQPARAGARYSMTSMARDEASEQFPLYPIRNAPATTTADDAKFIPIRSCTYATTSSGRNVVTPETFISNTSATLPRVSCMNVITHVRTYATSTITGTTAASRASSQSGFQPGTTLYAARKVPSARVTRSRHVAVTTESQSSAYVDGKVSYTTLTIPSDSKYTTSSSLVVPETHHTNTVTTGLGTYTTPMLTSDSIVRPGSHMLISIPNSQISPSTSLSYLLSPSLGSDIITPRRSTEMASTHSSATTGIASHTITTISSEVMNRIRSRFLIPVGHNVSSTATSSSSLPATTIPSDTNKTRGPVTIIANQLITAVSPRAHTTEGTATSRTLFSPSRNVYTITAPESMHLSSTTSTEISNRTVNRVVIPVRSSIHATSNVQSSNTTVTVPSSTTTLSFPGGHTQGAYFITTGMGASSSHTGGTTVRPSRVIIPIIHNTSAVTATTVTNISTTPFLGTTGEDRYTSMGNMDENSRLRNRLIIQATTAESSLAGTTTPITAFTITRSRAPQSVYAFPSASTTHTSSTKPSDTTNLKPATMTLITFDKTSVVSPTANSSQNLLAPGTAYGAQSLPMALCSMTTATPTLANTGNRYVIKLAAPTASTAASSVTAAVTTPITTSTISPPHHNFLEPQPVSKLRTFPGPRTYSVAQRSTPANVQLRMPVRNVTPRVTKKIIMNPAPLQIFADVVGPPTTTQSQNTTVTLDNSKPRHTLPHNSGNTSFVASPHKNTLFKNLSSYAHSQERSTSRNLSTRSSSDRFLLNRSVTFITPRRSAPGIQSETTGSVPQRAAPSVRLTYADIRSQTGRVTPATAAEHTTAEPATTPCTTSKDTSTGSNKNN